jgi:hypothetical protein
MTDLREKKDGGDEGEGWEWLGRDDEAYHEILAISVQTCVKTMIRIFSWRTRQCHGKDT